MTGPDDPPRRQQRLVHLQPLPARGRNDGCRGARRCGRRHRRRSRRARARRRLLTHRRVAGPRPSERLHRHASGDRGGDGDTPARRMPRAPGTRPRARRRRRTRTRPAARPRQRDRALRCGDLRRDAARFPRRAVSLVAPHGQSWADGARVVGGWRPDGGEGRRAPALGRAVPPRVDPHRARGAADRELPRRGRGPETSRDVGHPGGVGPQGGVGRPSGASPQGGVGRPSGASPRGSLAPNCGFAKRTPAIRRE